MTDLRCRTLPGLRQFVILLVAVQLLLCGCISTTRRPSLAYTHVATLNSISSDLGEPFGITVKGETIYLSDGANGTILEITADGASKILASSLNTPSGIAFLPNGNLCVADTGSHTIREVAMDGTVSILAGIKDISGTSDGPAATATFNAPVGLAVTEDGSIFIADTYNDRIRVIRGGVVSTIAGGSRGFADAPGIAAMFDTPLGIATWGDNILVADFGNARLRVIEPDGKVWTLAGSSQRELRDGSLSSALFVAPTAVAVDGSGTVFVTDGNAIRVIGRRSFPFVETLAGDGRGLVDGSGASARFDRPSGVVIGGKGELYVADSNNRRIRTIDDGGAEKSEQSVAASERSPEDTLPLATRWPFDPPNNPREVAGTLGEIRGEMGTANKPVWFHNGLDIAGAYGETTRFIRNETVLDPQSVENFGTSRELLRLPLIGYIHLRLGRDKSDIPFGDPRFQFDRDASGKLVDLRIRRGTKVAAGDALGTLNAMNHVHLIAGRSGREINALAAIQLPGIADSIAPVIEKVSLFTDEWLELKPEGKTVRIRLPDKTRIVVRAHDRMDGNSDRRKLGVYRVGYQLYLNGSPVSNPVWPIRFDRMPSNDAVRFVYAPGSQSGYTPNTIFDYIATNRVDGDSFAEGFLDTSTLAKGEYTLRVFVADYFGNVTSKDVEVAIER